ncbi:MAG: HEPN domain-containing protein [Candidatus Micrarchaeota archaeon]
MNVEECLDKGLLVKVKPDLEKALSSIKMGGRKLALAEKEFGHKIYESALISAYTSMFHSARAFLFKDGFKERSHYAIWVYLNEKCRDKIEKRHIGELNALRLQRHDLMYNLEDVEEVKEESASAAIKAAREFLEAVKKIVENRVGENANNKSESA